MPANKL